MNIDVKKIFFLTYKAHLQYYKLFVTFMIIMH